MVINCPESWARGIEQNWWAKKKVKAQEAEVSIVSILSNGIVNTSALVKLITEKNREIGNIED